MGSWVQRGPTGRIFSVLGAISPKYLMILGNFTKNWPKMVKNSQKIAFFGYFFDFFGQIDENRILPVVGSNSRGQKGPVPAILSPLPVQARRSSGGPSREIWAKIWRF